MSDGPNRPPSGSGSRSLLPFCGGQKASHRLYSIARASNYASFRGKKTAVDTAPEAADDGGDVEAPTAVRPGRHAEVARRPSLMSLPSFLSWTRTSTRPVVAPAPAPRLDAPA